MTQWQPDTNTYSYTQNNSFLKYNQSESSKKKKQFKVFKPSLLCLNPVLILAQSNQFKLGLITSI